MSSQPDDASRPKRTRRPFEQWRKVMLLGALILLGNALGDTLVEGGLPTWASLILTFLGYGFLAAGFGIRMREMKAAKEEAAKEQQEKTELES